MNSLHTSLTQLLKKLEDKEVLKKGKANTDKFKAEELAKYIRDLFVENYPELKVRRLMESVHDANNFENKVLQQTAFLVDEISEYMFALEIANRDFVVGYFNTLIIDSEIEATEFNFVLMEVNSLIENSFLELPEEE